jgi:hypothetical protein
MPSYWLHLESLHSEKLNPRISSLFKVLWLIVPHEYSVQSTGIIHHILQDRIVFWLLQAIRTSPHACYQLSCKPQALPPKSTYWIAPPCSLQQHHLQMASCPWLVDMTSPAPRHAPAAPWLSQMRSWQYFTEHHEDALARYIHLRWDPPSQPQCM